MITDIKGKLFHLPAGLGLDLYILVGNHFSRAGNTHLNGSPFDVCGSEFPRLFLLPCEEKVLNLITRTKNTRRTRVVRIIHRFMPALR